MIAGQGADDRRPLQLNTLLSMPGYHASIWSGLEGGSGTPAVAIQAQIQILFGWKPLRG
jgi:hypothetical protein